MTPASSARRGEFFSSLLEPVGPSPLSYGPGRPEARALTLEEIPAAVDAWGQAARRTREGGFDVLEIHAAHGCLIHSFFSSLANQRRDACGGSEERRHRFALEVTEAVRAQWPEGKPLLMRLLVEDDAGLGPKENIRFRRVAKMLGPCAIDCSSGGIDHRVRRFSRMNRYRFQAPFAAQGKRGAGIAAMAVGLVIHGDRAEKTLQDGDAGLIGVARETIRNPP